jgi:8-oxo-dGTP diphosphatase
MKVAVALITDEQQRLLITQRPLHVPQGGLWEFPGGKLEPKETAQQALVRELREELGINVQKYRLLGEVTHQYPEKLVQLIIFHVTEYSGTALCLEGQLDMKWIKKERVNPEYFPEANRPLFEMFSLLDKVT